MPSQISITYYCIPFSDYLLWYINVRHLQHVFCFSLFVQIKLKTKKQHTVGTNPKSNIKIVERGKIDTPYTQIHDCSFSSHGTDISIQCDGVKLVLNASPFSDMMWSFKSFPQMITNYKRNIYTD